MEMCICLRQMLQMSAYMCAYLSILMFKMLFLQDNGNNFE